MAHLAVVSEIFFKIIKRHHVSPGLEVIRGDSCKLFESQQHILDGHFLQIFVVKIVRFVRKGKNKQKESGDGPF